MNEPHNTVAPEMSGTSCDSDQPWPASPLCFNRQWLGGTKSLCVAIAAIIVYLLTYSPYWWIGLDSGLYLNLSRSLAEGHGYVTGGRPHTLVPPGFPLMLAGLMKLGLGSFAALNAVMLVFSLAAVWLCYRVLAMLVSRDWAVLLTCFVALTREYVLASGEILSDMPATVLVLASMWMYLKACRSDKSRPALWIAAGVLSLLSLTFRMALIPLSVGLALGAAIAGWRRQRLCSIASLAGVLAVMGVLAWLWFGYANANANALSAPYTIQASHAEGLAARTISSILFAGGQLSRLVTGQRMPEAVCIVLLVIPVLLGMARRIKLGEWITPVATLCYIGGLVIATTKPRTRYLIPIAPLLVLQLLEGYALIAGWLIRRRSGCADSTQNASVQSCSAPNKIVISLAAVMLAMNLALVGRLIVDKHRSDFRTAQQKGKYAYVWPVADCLGALPADGNVLAIQPVLYLAGREGPFLSGKLLRSTPAPDQMPELLNQWNIRYVVCKPVKPDDPPFLNTLRQYMSQTGRLLMSSHGAEIYEVPLR